MFEEFRRVCESFKGSCHETFAPYKLNSMALYELSKTLESSNNKVTLSNTDTLKFITFRDVGRASKALRKLQKLFLQNIAKTNGPTITFFFMMI